MAKRKTAKFAVLASAISLMLSCVMLFGSTFAWFTDSVANEGNIIASGTLKIGLSSSDTADGTYVDASEGKIFNYANWEPGYTQVKYVKVENKGTLAFKWNLTLDSNEEETEVNGEKVKLSEVIDVYMGTVAANRNDVTNMTCVGTLAGLMADEDGAAYGTLEAGKAITQCIVLKMQESADNRYQNLKIGDGIAVKLNAEQLTYEEDSFGPDYDTNAGLPVAAIYRNPDNENVPINWSGYGIWLPDAPYEDYPLEAAYTFTATEPNVAESPYKDWWVDFYVSLDRDLTADQLFLGGSYGGYLVGFNVDNDILGIGYPETNTLPANTTIPLLGSVTGGMSNWTYEAIVNGVQEFGCGVSDIDDALTGAVFTVELRAMNPDNTDEYVVISKVDYTFGYSTPAGVAAALAAGENVVLDADIDLGETTVTIPAGTTATLDLNGHTLSYATTEAKATHAIENKGTLTLKNGTVTYEGVGDSSFGYGTNTINNSGELIIDGATIINTTTSGSSVAIDCSAGADLTVKSGVIKSEKNAIRLCPFGSEAINCTIDGGKITGARAVQIQLPSNKPADAPEINLTINGGELTGTSGLALYSYSAGQSFANVGVTITGGTFKGDVCFGGGNAKTTEETVTITGGTFNGELGRYLANDGWEDIAKP